MHNAKSFVRNQHSTNCWMCDIYVICVTWTSFKRTMVDDTSGEPESHGKILSQKNKTKWTQDKSFPSSLLLFHVWLPWKFKNCHYCAISLLNVLCSAGSWSRFTIYTDWRDEYFPSLWIWVTQCELFIKYIQCFTFRF